MKKNLPKAYEPSKYEDGIYKKWEKSGFFNPDNLDLPKNAPSYTIILPPPNITDKLHLGHSSMLAIEDLLIRYHRMKGYRALWLPGTDHAAIATQNVVEKKLLKEERKTRHDLGREKFLEKIWEFVKITQSVILHQTRKMGASLDWSREAFTLDEPREKAVKKMFVDMYEAGVIYRGERIVNWCPRCHSTLADDEVEYEEQKAKLYTFKYSKDFPFTIATTRPETKLGDTAVAVNPKDKRYKKYIGKIYEVDFVGIKLKLKIIADRHVEMDFGAGALGVTPAHSMADWQMAEANDLEIIKVIGEDGKINNNFLEYSGKAVEEAREMIVAKLRKNNLLEKEEEIENNLSVCYRCNTPIEPLPSKQWFINVDKKLKRLGGETRKHENTKTRKHKIDIEGKTLKEAAIEAVKSGKIKFIPERFEKRYLDWMENLHDWCISRQIWFGHRIPVWYRTRKHENTKTRKHENTKTRKHENTKTRKHEIEEIYVGVEAPKGEGWVQDPDSLDTWFSSGMWTFSTLGWPDNFKNGKKTGDLARFHPTQVLETGYDILTLWVSRMIMMSLFALREIPFENVYLHGMVLDEHGKKMSKSKGNGIDPVDMIDKFGADAVRLSLLIGNTPGNDLRLSEDKIAGFRNLVNKIWNVSRYVISDFRFQISDFRFNQKNLTVSDKWILEKMENLIKQTGDDLDSYRFSQAGERLREFTWNDFADWYLEASKFEKTEEKEKILAVILNDLLKLWHPFIPFVTEKIWAEMGNDKFLMVEKWPACAKASAGESCGNAKFCVPTNTNDFELIKNIITAIRNARAENKIEPARKVKAIICGKNVGFIKSQEHLIKNMRTGINELEIEEKADKMKNRRSPLRDPSALMQGHRAGTAAGQKTDAICITVVDVEIYLINAVDEEKEKNRIKKEIENLEKLIIMAEKKLSNKEFIAKAPEKIVKQEKEKLKLRKEELKKLKK